jgi:hypothetical protein
VVLHRLRRGRLLPALLAVGLLVGTGLPGAHDAADDLACERPVSAADRATTLDMAAWLSGADHCEVCHWLRSLRTLDVPIGVAVLGPVGEAQYAVDPSERAARDSRSALFPRGPPS